MIEIAILVMVIACPVMMGVMMLLMWRGMRGHHRPDEPSPPRQPSNGET